MSTNVQANSMQRRSALTAALILPSFLVLALFFASPLVWTLILSFLTPTPAGSFEATFTFGNYLRFLTDSYYLGDLLGRTLYLATVATIWAVAIGYMGAYVITRARPKYQTLLIFLVMCPLWVNLVIRTLSLMVILGRNGPLNQLLMSLGFTERPLPLLFNETAVIIGMVQVSVPFVVTSIYGVIQSIPRSLEQAALSVGANPVQAFLRVTLPLSLPGLLAGSMLGFIINIESFVVPILLGGQRVRMMSVAAYEAATIGSNLPFAATIGIILLVVTLVTLMLYQTFVGRLNRSAAAIRAA